MSTAHYHPDEWEWFGSPAHFICADDCRFHLATLVGPWVVSTVGEYLPDSGSWDLYAKRAGVNLAGAGQGDERRNQFLDEVGWVDIGAGRKYETFVFRASGKRCETEDCACGLPEWEGSEIDSEGYNERGPAQRGHMTMCETWSRRPRAWADEKAA